MCDDDLDLEGAGAPDPRAEREAEVAEGVAAFLQLVDVHAADRPLATVAAACVLHASADARGPDDPTPGMMSVPVLIEDPVARAALLEQGRALRRQFEGLVNSAAKGAFELTLLGHPTLAVEAVSEFTSDLGNILALRTGTFAVVFKIDSAQFVKVSLRSLPGFDVSQIALQFGGGGHPQASAFRLPMARFADFLAGTLQPA